jgi:peptide-N-glycosidase F-like protein
MRTATFLLLLAACSDAPPVETPIDAAVTVDAPFAAPDAATTPDTTVSVFDHKPVYFTGSDNQRTAFATAAFPTDGKYEHIVLHLALDCPSGGCDWWDRFGTVGVVSGTDAIELVRFVTPYRVAGHWDYDITDLRPLLSGSVTVRGFIDTWVGPGHQNGSGWLLSVSIEMKGGQPAREPIAVIPIWTQRDAVYGDPARPISMFVPPANPTLPVASAFALRTFVTGHGQGNADNCSEFCSRSHSITVGSTVHSLQLWRDDCATTAVPGQQGTWQYSRAGWCPGADVRPWVVDVDFQTGTTITYDVDSYVNTCRPDAQTCTGCTLGTGCAYDGGAHTEPHYTISTLLVAFR